MKKIVLALMMIAGALQLKAQTPLHMMPVDTSATSLKKYFSKPNNGPFNQFAPQLRLNDLNRQRLSQVLANAPNTDIDNMPIARTQGNSKMPIATFSGNSKMPVINPANGERLDLSKPPVEKKTP